MYVCIYIHICVYTLYSSPRVMEPKVHLLHHSARTSACVIAPPPRGSDPARLRTPRDSVPRAAPALATCQVLPCAAPSTPRVDSIGARLLSHFPSVLDMLVYVKSLFHLFMYNQTFLIIGPVILGNIKSLWRPSNIKSFQSPSKVIQTFRQR
jgi:hypothetical protein